MELCILDVEQSVFNYTFFVSNSKAEGKIGREGEKGKEQERVGKSKEKDTIICFSGLSLLSSFLTYDAFIL